jgi:hypothetical protein
MGELFGYDTAFFNSILVAAEVEKFPAAVFLPKEASQGCTCPCAISLVLKSTQVRLHGIRSTGNDKDYVLLE